MVSQSSADSSFEPFSKSELVRMSVSVIACVAVAAVSLSVILAPLTAQELEMAAAFNETSSSVSFIEAATATTAAVLADVLDATK